MTIVEIGMSWLGVLGAYVVGALPMGYWIAQSMGIDDIRRCGSGNIGATNVARILGAKFFFIIFFLDCSKAYVYLTLCYILGFSDLFLYVSACTLLFGNSCSIFLQGTGGKGMATSMGILFALNASVATAAIGVWALVALYTRTAGIASVATAIVLPWFASFVFDAYGVALMSVMAIWIVWRHRTNIRLYCMVRS